MSECHRFCVVADGSLEDALPSKVWACISSTTCCALLMSRGIVAEVHKLPAARGSLCIRFVMAFLNLLALVSGFQLVA